MSEGRLSSIRETDRLAGLLAGVAAGTASAVTVAIAQSLGADVGTPLIATAALLAFVLGWAEGVIAARFARRAADQFRPLNVFVLDLARIFLIINVAAAVAGALLTLNGFNAVAAVVLAAGMATAVTLTAVALFGWSHSIDWPQIPDYLRTVPATSHVQAAEQPQLATPPVDVRQPVEESPLVQRGADADDPWKELQDMISGKRDGISG